MSSRITFSIMDLHPVMRGPVTQLIPLLNSGHARGVMPLFKPFEGYRTPDAQNREYREGNSKARAWQSAHQYGLAVDVVPQVDGRWTWDVPDAEWAWMQAQAKKVGLIVPISWDKPHLEHPAWATIKATL